jgi:hypothetical protein
MANPIRSETHRTALVAVMTALREFARRRAMERLLAMDLPDLTPEAVEAIRQPRR